MDTTMCETCVMYGRCEGCAEIDGQWTNSDCYSEVGDVAEYWRALAEEWT